MKPAEHKLVLQVFDENRLTRDDFLGMVELNLLNLPKEQPGRTIPAKQYILRPRRLVTNIDFINYSIILYTNVYNLYIIFFTVIPVKDPK